MVVWWSWWRSEMGGPGKGFALTWMPFRSVVVVVVVVAVLGGWVGGCDFGMWVWV
jgi:hypothetical protein